MTIVYVDVLFCINLVVNYVLLLSVSMAVRVEASALRMCFGAIVGALCSFVILLPPMGIPINVVIRLLISVLTVMPVFGFKSKKLFIKICVCFLSFGFLFAGIMFAVMQLLAPSGLFVNNASVYINVSPVFIVLMTLICYTALSLFERFFGHRLPKETQCTVAVRLSDNEAVFKAITDTGNSLTEAFSDYPVIIANEKATEKLISREILQKFLNGETLDDSILKRKLRIVPYNTVSGGGLLPAFRPDEVVIKNEFGEIKLSKVYIAVSERKISDDFDAIVNSEIFKSL